MWTRYVHGSVLSVCFVYYYCAVPIIQTRCSIGKARDDSMPCVHIHIADVQCREGITCILALRESWVQTCSLDPLVHGNCVFAPCTFCSELAIS